MPSLPRNLRFWEIIHLHDMTVQVPELISGALLSAMARHPTYVLASSVEPFLQIALMRTQVDTGKAYILKTQFYARLQWPINSLSFSAFT